MSAIINLLKTIRKTSQLKRTYTRSYAFLGIGNHSLHNLYPVLDYLHVPLKYIVTKSRRSADLVNNNFKHVLGTTDFNQVLNDPQIGGILISAAPSSHFQLVRQSLAHYKHVFVEKPPCTTTEELKTLIGLQRKSKCHCLTGFQKRYARGISILNRRLNNEMAIAYNYRFTTGPYPEGDPYFELFLHPIDLLQFLFGKGEMVSFLKTSGTGGRTTAFMQFRHGNTLGTLEASTHYSWLRPEEQLVINTTKGVYHLKNHQQLTFQPKAGSIFSVPREKAFPSPLQKHYLYQADSFLPIFTNNQIVSQGYFNAIDTFINLCEGRKAHNLSGLADILHSLDLIDQIRKKP